MSASLSLHDITFTRGDSTILDKVDLTVTPGRRIGVVGPNGVGKSTLLAVCAGKLAVDDGEIRIAPPRATIGWLPQEPQRSDETVRQQLHRRTGVAAAQHDLDAATNALADGSPDVADRYDHVLERWLALGAADLDARVGAVCDELNLTLRLLGQPTSSLSGGEAARVGLAALMLSRFDLYLLDEPTNDLDLDGLGRLEDWIVGLDAGVLLVSHDRRFLQRAVTDVVEIDEFSHRVRVFGGGWQTYLDERELARQHAWGRFAEYDSRRRNLAGRAQREREWASQGLAGVKRSQNDESDKHVRRYRIDQTEQLAARAARTQKAMERLEAVEKPREPWQLRLDIPDAPRGADIVARLTGATVRRPDFALGPIDLLVELGDRVALCGSNGSGKTTLIGLILGRVEPSCGTAKLGSNVIVGEIEQARARFDGAETLLRAFADATALQTVDARTLLAKFGLVGSHVTRTTSSLSPGERTRAALALLMANGANLLVLDEPTNHLDLPAIEQLEQALDTFAGTLLVVTHDREFLDRLRITRTIVLEKGQVK